jgi:hypothetical protein
MPAIQAVPARFPDPTDPPTPVKIVSRWEQFLGALTTGMYLEDAMLACFIKKREIQAMINSGPVERKRYQEAKVAGLRSAYSEFDLDEFFNRVAMGTTVADAFMEVFGKPVHSTFYEILRSDPDMEERYQSALKTKAVLEVEKVLDIVDDASNDTLEGLKGPMPNMAAVNRSKLRAETRTKLGGLWYRRLFGEKEPAVQVNVTVNHAERLEEARARARDKTMTPRKISEFTDAVYEAKVEEQPMSTDWMEDK